MPAGLLYLPANRNGGAFSPTLPTCRSKVVTGCSHCRHRPMSIRRSYSLLRQTHEFCYIGGSDGIDDKQPLPTCTCRMATRAQATPLDAVDAPVLTVPGHGEEGLDIHVLSDLMKRLLISAAAPPPRAQATERQQFKLPRFNDKSDVELFIA